MAPQSGDKDATQLHRTNLENLPSASGRPSGPPRLGLQPSGSRPSGPPKLGLKPSIGVGAQVSQEGIFAAGTGVNARGEVRPGSGTPLSIPNGPATQVHRVGAGVPGINSGVPRTDIPTAPVPRSAPTPTAAVPRSTPTPTAAVPRSNQRLSPPQLTKQRPQGGAAPGLGGTSLGATGLGSTSLGATGLGQSSGSAQAPYFPPNRAPGEGLSATLPPEIAQSLAATQGSSSRFGGTSLGHSSLPPSAPMPTGNPYQAPQGGGVYPWEQRPAFGQDSIGSHQQLGGSLGGSWMDTVSRRPDLRSMSLDDFIKSNTGHLTPSETYARMVKEKEEEEDNSSWGRFWRWFGGPGKYVVLSFVIAMSALLIFIGFVFQRTQERRQPLPPSIPGNYQPAAPNFEEEGQVWGSRQDGRRGDGMWGSEDRGEAKASEGGNMREGALYPLMTPAPSKKGNNSKAAPQGGAKSAPAKAAPPARSEPLPEVGEPRDTNPPSNVGEDEGVFKMGEDEFAPL